MAESAEKTDAQSGADQQPANTTPARYRVQEVPHYSVYRDGYRRMLRLVQIQAAVIVVLVALIAVARLTIQPEFSYFASTRDGEVKPLRPLESPPDRPQ